MCVSLLCVCVCVCVVCLGDFSDLGMSVSVPVSSFARVCVCASLYMCLCLYVRARVCVIQSHRDLLRLRLMHTNTRAPFTECAAHPRRLCAKAKVPCSAHILYRCGRRRHNCAARARVTQGPRASHHGTQHELCSERRIGESCPVLLEMKRQLKFSKI